MEGTHKIGMVSGGDLLRARRKAEKKSLAEPIACERLESEL
jgi:hypothetical protein